MISSKAIMSPLIAKGLAVTCCRRLNDEYHTKFNSYFLVGQYIVISEYKDTQPSLCNAIYKNVLYKSDNSFIIILKNLTQDDYVNILSIIMEDYKKCLKE